MHTTKTEDILLDEIKKGCHKTKEKYEGVSSVNMSSETLASLLGKGLIIQDKTFFTKRKRRKSKVIITLTAKGEKFSKGLYTRIKKYEEEKL